MQVDASTAMSRNDHRLVADIFCLIGLDDGTVFPRELDSAVLIAADNRVVLAHRNRFAPSVQLILPLDVLITVDKVFLVINHTQSISGAAASLFLSQPTVSRKLSQLENEPGTQLFFRSKGHERVFLTTQGKKFVTIANAIMELYEEALLWTLPRDSAPTSRNPYSRNCRMTRHLHESSGKALQA